MLKEDIWNAQDNKWRTIWKYQGPHRIPFFLWLIYRQQLLTNLERLWRGIGQNATYLVCHHNTKDILHVLRDCQIAKEVWLSIVPKNRQSHFFLGNLLEWVGQNLKKPRTGAKSRGPLDHPLWLDSMAPMERH